MEQHFSFQKFCTIQGCRVNYSHSDLSNAETKEQHARNRMPSVNLIA